MDHSRNPQSRIASPAESGNCHLELGSARRTEVDGAGRSLGCFPFSGKARHKSEMLRIAYSWIFLAFAVVHIMVSFSFVQRIGQSRDGLALFLNVLWATGFLGLGMILVIAWWSNLMQRKASRRLGIVASLLNLLVFLGAAAFVYLVGGFVMFRQVEWWCLGIPTLIAIVGSVIYSLPNRAGGSADGQMSPAPVTFPNSAEGAPSPLGTGDSVTTQRLHP